MNRCLRITNCMPESDPFLHVVLHQPDIPQNTGNIGRTCVAVGAKLWLVRPLGFHLDERHLRRAGMDYWEHLDWEAVENWGEIQERLQGRTFWYLTKTGSTACVGRGLLRGAMCWSSAARPADLPDFDPGRASRTTTCRTPCVRKSAV